MFGRIVKPTLSAIVQIIVLALAVAWILDSGAQAMGYRWQWDRVPDYIAFYEDGEWWPAELLEGLLVTIQISMISLVATLAIGLVTALLRNSNSVVGRTIATGYVELIRNTPLLVQIYLLYFVFGPVIGLDRFSTAVLALALFQGAYTAEIFRAGLNSIERGQFEAARSLGLSRTFTFWDVILPQVIQRTLPPLTNEVISLIKNSSIVSVMAVFDLTTEARNIVSETAMPFEIWFSVAIIYLALTLSLSAIAAWLEHKLGANWRTQ
ncbi:amino acid ABC transporter permease [Vibrio breoganii]|uniref:Putative glutamine transport system permease protein GlnP n=1 Tax=Vibrio breoganii TaxID=553239 RepID=A0AAP8MWU6_9VIBR|nr:amino acid ABC transporter permease [Vibrio breoganii]OCH74875.1 polar amino acid ABC transporter permease [Vibrio breoganii]OED96947.1 polar amino acid ABC transporter permease [Vibrio breoganii ZF-29]OEF86778.1 polar amino acid ABC transporter permease [Vibrio breoganii 1C10]PMG03972.1 polar amino acid ABC transporter permease [Vibrio breoganii]PMG07489.1 polar amino acid ABC transporter permease [Vibrio breoganii]